MNTNFFDFTLEPGKQLKKEGRYEQQKPIISVIMPFYNDKKYIRQAVYSVLNQTFPYFELIIVDDGSKDEESLEELKHIEKIDDRIKVLHKQNEGLAATRDYGANNASGTSKYLFFLDSDDMIEKTYFECAYWTLETNKDAGWAYTDSVGFEADNYVWNKWFDPNKMKKQNDLVATAMIRKKDFNEVKGYELREKAVNEDWNFWLKMIAKRKFPVRMNFYGFWYRRKLNAGELKKANSNRNRTLEIISKTIKEIKNPVYAKQYPIQNYNWDLLSENIDNILIPNYKNEKINILIIIPWMTTGGADKFNIDLLKGLDREKYDVTIVTTEAQINNYRQEFEKYSTVFDLTTFLDRKYWLAFINYIMKSRNINCVLNTNSRYGYSILPYIKGKYPNVPIIDYIHMEEWYNRNGGYSRDSSGVESVIDKTLVCNKNSERILIDHFGRNENAVQTVYIGVNEKEYNPENITEEDKIKILNKYKINKDNRYVISYICRIAEQKRPHLLIQIIKMLKTERKDFLFVVAGDGYMLNDIKKEAQKYNLTNDIVFTGNIKNTKEIYAISDMTINCSIKEGLALTSYESLSMGIPVVSADVGGQKELIDDTVGKIVPCLQKEEDIFDFDYKKEEIENYVIAINEVLNNLQKYKNNCRKRILDGFTIDQMREKMNNIIAETVKNPSQANIENGKGLSKNLNICKELICMFLQESKKDYEWQCIQYNLTYYELDSGLRVTRFSILKEKLWKHKTYRIFIKCLQKMGIIKRAKKIIKRG